MLFAIIAFATPSPHIQSNTKNKSETETRVCCRSSIEFVKLKRYRNEILARKYIIQLRIAHDISFERDILVGTESIQLEENVQ